MAQTTDQLMNGAACIDKCMPDGEKLAVLIYIFQQILQNGTGGGGTSGASFLSGAGSPVGTATPTVVGQTYLDTTTDNLWISTGLVNTNWVELVEPTETINLLITGAVGIDWSVQSLYSGTLTGNVTFSFSNAVNGQTMVVRITNTLGNTFTVTWPGVGTLRWPSGAAPVQSVNGQTDIYTFVRSNGLIYGIANQGY